MEVRVRYAPSPTGMQHIGGVRTALFNYLFARANGGKFILRLEDTDRTRYGEEYVQNLYDTMDWLGIEWDEGGEKGGEYGPYVQSQRFELYKKYAQELVEKGQAYYCFCDAERLDRIRSIQTMNKMPPGYDRNCRHLTEEEITALKELTTYYPTTNISVSSEQLDGYTVFNYPISMANGWNYVKQQLNDNRDYIYDMDSQSAEAYVNSEYAVTLTELEV